MAAITHGPRLGDPRSDGFSVWARTDGAASMALAVRPAGSSSWSTVDTKAVDVSKDNTVVLTVTGLQQATLYEYRISINGVAGTTYSTRTMPHSGRFVIYYVSDSHDGQEVPIPGNATYELYSKILTHYEATYEDDGIPAVILHNGDIFGVSAFGYTLATWASTNVLPTQVNLDAAGATRKLPLIYIWDDHDFAGNNSTSFARVTPSAVITPHSAAMTVYDYYWRNTSGFPAAPSVAQKYQIAGVPILVTDGRSQKMPSNVTAPLCGQAGLPTPYLWNDQTLTYSTMLGSVQREWLRSELAAAATKGLVLLISGTTFKNAIHEQRAPYQDGGIRDSFGIYHIAERNNIFQSVAQLGYAWRNNLVVLSGDDHWCVVWRDVIRENISPGDSLGPLPVAPSYPSAPTTWTVPFIEFKTNGNSDTHSRNAGNSPILFGPGNYYSRDVVTQAPTSDLHATFIVFDIQSNDDGRDVQMRATYKVAHCDIAAHAALETETDDLGREGDFYFENGNFQHYSESGMQTQSYPPDNIAPNIFQRAYVDDITGLLVRESKVRRDEDHLLRAAEDIGQRDRDWELRDWKPRVEEVPYEP